MAIRLEIARERATASSGLTLASGCRDVPPLARCAVGMAVGWAGKVGAKHVTEA